MGLNTSYKDIYVYFYDVQPLVKRPPVSYKTPIVLLMSNNELIVKSGKSLVCDRGKGNLRKGRNIVNLLCCENIASRYD